MAAITTAIIAGAAIAGTAAVAGGVIAARGAKSAAKTQAESQQQVIVAQQKAAAEEQVRVEEATAIKRAAVEDIKFPTFLETPEAQEFKGTLQERIAGRGLIDVDALTSPIAQARRASLQEQTIPAIGSAASARGLGRSTIPVSQIGQASQAAERDINERLAQLEIQRQGQIERATTQFGLLAEEESRSQQARASFERGGEFAVAETQVQAAQIFRQNEFAIAESIRQEGALAAAARLKEAEILAGGLVGAGTAASSALQTQSLIDAIDKIDAGTIGQPKTLAATVARA